MTTREKQTNGRYNCNKGRYCYKNRRQTVSFNTLLYLTITLPPFTIKFNPSSFCWYSCRTVYATTWKYVFKHILFTCIDISHSFNLYVIMIMSYTPVKRKYYYLFYKPVEFIFNLFNISALFFYFLLRSLYIYKKKIINGLTYQIKLFFIHSLHQLSLHSISFQLLLKLNFICYLHLLYNLIISCYLLKLLIFYSLYHIKLFVTYFIFYLFFLLVILNYYLIYFKTTLLKKLVIYFIHLLKLFFISCYIYRSIFRNFDEFIIKINNLIFQPDCIISTETFTNDESPAYQLPNYTYIPTKININKNSLISVFVHTKLSIVTILEHSILHTNCIQTEIKLDKYIYHIIAIYRTHESIIALFLLLTLGNMNQTQAISPSTSIKQHKLPYYYCFIFLFAIVTIGLVLNDLKIHNKY